MDISRYKSEIVKPDYEKLHKMYMESQEKLSKLTDSVL